MSVPLKGNFIKIPFPAIFAKISREKRSGVLSLGDPETKKVRKRIGFKGGNQVYVAGGTINETLGRLLLKWGKITEKQYHECITAQKTNDKLAGEVLISMKIMNSAQLAEALKMQTEEKILGCFAWPDGIYSFTEAAPPEDKKLLFFPISPEKIIAEGIKRYFNQQRLEQVLKPWYSAKFRRNSNFAEIQKNMGIAPQEARVMQGFKDGFGLKELLSSSPADAVATLQLLFAMLITNMIEPIGVATSNPQSPPKSKPVAEPQEATQPKAAEPQVAQPKPAEEAPVAPEPPPPPPQPEAPEPPPPEEEEPPGQFGIEGEDDAEVEQDTAQAAKARPAPRPKKPGADREEKAKQKTILDEIAHYEQMVEEGTFFDLLSVKKEAGLGEIKKSFFRLAKKFHPDTNPAFFQGEFKERAEEVFTRIGEAYNTLIDPKARDEYVYAIEHQISQEDIDQANRALEAEGAFLKAEVLFKKGDFRGAHTFIEEAIELNPEEPEYYVYYGWSLYKSSRGEALGEARKNLQKALDMGLRDKFDMAHYYLGMLAKVEGRPVDEQKRHFAAAVEANANNTQAASELRHLDMRAEKAGAGKVPPDKKKGGFFGRFKK